MKNAINEFVQKMYELLDWAKGNDKIDPIVADEEFMPEIEHIAKEIIAKYSK